MDKLIINVSKVNTAILIGILIFGAAVLFKIFDFNSNLAKIENKLDKSKENLEQILDSISSAKNDIESLRNRIDFIKTQNTIYQSKRDSLEKIFKIEIANYAMKLDDVKDKNELAKANLKYLREENDKFR